MKGGSLINITGRILPKEREGGGGHFIKRPLLGKGKVGETEGSNWNDFRVFDKTFRHMTRSPDFRYFHCRSQFFTQSKNRSNASIEVSRIYGSTVDVV